MHVCMQIKNRAAFTSGEVVVRLVVLSIIEWVRQNHCTMFL